MQKVKWNNFVVLAKNLPFKLHQHLWLLSTFFMDHTMSSMALNRWEIYYVLSTFVLLNTYSINMIIGVSKLDLLVLKKICYHYLLELSLKTNNLLNVVDWSLSLQRHDHTQLDLKLNLIFHLFHNLHLDSTGYGKYFKCLICFC